MVGLVKAELKACPSSVSPSTHLWVSLRKDQIVAAGASKAFKGRGRGWHSGLMGADKRDRVGSRGPGYSVVPNGVAIEDIGDGLAII